MTFDRLTRLAAFVTAIFVLVLVFLTGAGFEPRVGWIVAGPAALSLGVWLYRTDRRR